MYLLRTSDVNKDLRHKAKAKDTADKTKAKASKNNCSRPRRSTNITDYESTNPCRIPADLIGTAAPFAIGRGCWLVPTNQPTNRSNLFQII